MQNICYLEDYNKNKIPLENIIYYKDNKFFTFNGKEIINFKNIDFSEILKDLENYINEIKNLKNFSPENAFKNKLDDILENIYELKSELTDFEINYKNNIFKINQELISKIDKIEFNNFLKNNEKILLEYIEKIENIKNNIYDEINDFKINLKNYFQEFENKKNLLNSEINDFSKKINSIKNNFEKIKKDFDDNFEENLNKIEKIKKDFENNLKNKLNEIDENIKNKLNEFENNLKNNSNEIEKEINNLKNIIFKNFEEIEEDFKNKKFLNPDFNSGWITVNQNGAVLKNPIGQNAYFLGFQKFPNGDIMQFGVFSSYEDDDLRNNDSGMFLVIKKDKLIVSVYKKDNDKPGFIAGISDGISYDTGQYNNIKIKIIGWKLPKGII